MKRALPLILIIVFFFSPIANSIHNKRHSRYGSISGAKYIRNYDGDTITVDIPGYPAIIGDDIAIRLNGIDTPEIRGKCAKEKALARKAKHQVEMLLANADNIELRNIQRGKYFRIVADVWVDNHSISKILIQKNLAIPYDGGRKTTHWCD